MRTYIGIDTETDDPLLDSSGPSWKHGQGSVLCAMASGFEGCQLKELPRLMNRADVTLVGANIGYDLLWLCCSANMAAFDIRCGVIDICAAESYIDRYAPFSLDALARKYLNSGKQNDELQRVCRQLGLSGDVRKHLGKLWGLSDEYKALIREYCKADATQARDIWLKQKVTLEAKGFMPAFETDMKMLKLCLQMEQAGVRIDYPKWKENSKKAKEIYGRLEKEYFGKYGEVNINSPKQMGEFLDRHNIPYSCRITVRGKTPPGGVKFKKAVHAFAPAQVRAERSALKKQFPGIRIEKGLLRLYVGCEYAERTAGQISALGYDCTVSPNIDKRFIADNAAAYPAVKDLADYKQAGNIVSKFLGEGFEKFIVNHGNGEYRVHGSFNVVGARQTSRLSASKPNLQQLPSKCFLFEGTPDKVDLSKMCREVFISEPGHVWVKLDFSGQEARLQAHFAVGENGERIRKLYKENPLLDEHQYVATVSELEAQFGKDKGRKLAKNVRFGVGYGMTLPAMCRNNGWDREFGEEVYGKVVEASPWCKETSDKVQEVVKARGYIKTIAGREIWLRDFDPYAPASVKDSWPAYQFYPYLIQGAASDQTKLAQSRIADEIPLHGTLLSIHDESDHSVPATPEGLQIVLKMKDIYENALRDAGLSEVPFICEPEAGPNWAVGGKREEGETLEQWWERVCGNEGLKEREFRVYNDDEGEEEDENV